MLEPLVPPPSWKRRMPHWVLRCPECHKVFSHSPIPARSVVIPYDPLWPDKPEFPEGGVSLGCPVCHKIVVYQRFELMYKPD
jgi:uncharacterized C2H2 Zn-finger protein